MRAFDEGGVERDDVHEHAEPELLLEETFGDVEFGGTKLRIDEQLHRVVAGLAVDVDRASEIRSEGII